MILALRHPVTILAALWICLGDANCLQAQTHKIDVRKIDEFLLRSCKKLSIPNLELLIVNKSEVVYRYSTDSTATYDKPFFMGSVSKSLTAFGVLRLVEQGRLELDSRVTDILPELEFNSFAQEVTVRTLLNHTSGIKRTQGFDSLPSLDRLKSSRHVIATHFKPASRHEYSNLNYSILGLIVERLSGLSFAEYMNQAVFTPLHMADASAGDRSEVEAKAIAQYQYWGPFPVRSRQVDFDRVNIPAGFLVASSNDLSKYLQMHLSDGNFNGVQMLSPLLRTTMLTPWEGNAQGYAMGMKKGFYNDLPFYQHLGSTPTSYNGLFLIPDSGLGFVMLTNTNSISHSEKILEGVLSILTNGPPSSVAPTEFWLRTAILLTLIGAIYWLVYQLVGLLRVSDTFRIERRTQITRVIFQSAAIAAFVWFCPLVFSIPFNAFLSFQPDMGVTILCLFGFPLTLSIFRLMARTAPPDSADHPR
jgi:CubicO group peptidase (beta-lactamase class C family)